MTQQVLVLNFGHPFHPTAQQQLEALYPNAIIHYHSVNSQVDHTRNFMEQMRFMVKQVSGKWDKIVVNPPGYSMSAILTSLLLLHDHMEVDFIRLKPVINGAITEYHVDNVYRITAESDFDDFDIEPLM